MVEAGGDTPTRPLDDYRATIHDIQLDPRSTALVVVDLQYGSASGEYGYGRALRAIGQGDVVDGYVHRVNEIVIPAVRRLEDAFRAARAPVAFLTFGTITGDYSDMPPRFRRGADYWRSLGHNPPYARMGTREMEVLEPVAPLPSELSFVKTCASGFESTQLKRALAEMGVRSLVFCGVTTSYCVESNFRDAADAGFDVVLAEDGCAELTTPMHERGVAGCAAFGRIATSAAIAAELRLRP